MTSQKKRRSSRGATVSADTSALPLVSVILPVRNESGFIGRCIEALAAQTYPPDRLEIIMVDGDSTDSTLEEARSTAAATGLKIAVKTNPRRTTATGFNLGLNEARGDVIVRVDGHTRVDSDFVAASISALNDSDASAVGGPIRTEGEGPIGRAIALAMSSPFGIGDAVFRHADAQEQWTDSVPFGAYRREVFDRLGGLAEDVDSGEDDEFNYRLRRSGGGILLSPSIRSTYYARGSYSTLAQQYWRYGLAKTRVLQRHPGRLRLRHLVPSALLLAVSSGAILSVIDRRFGWLAFLSGGAYAAANGFASLRIASRGHKPELPYLPAAFACIHLPAGAGLLYGFVRGVFRARTK